MNIESGIAEGIGRVAPVAGASLESMFGPRMGSIMPEGGSFMGAKNLGTIDLIGGTNKQSLRSVDLKPGVSPVGGEILFQAKLPSVPNVIQQAETVAAAAWKTNEPPAPMQPVLQAESIQAIAESAEPRMIKEATYWFTDIPGPRVVKQAEIIMPLVAPKIIEHTQSQPQTRPENRVSAHPAVAPAQSPAVLPQSAPEEEEEVVTVVTQKVEEEESEGEEDEFSMKKKIHLVDQPVLTTVLSETNEAIEKAKDEAERLGLGRRILGYLVARFSPSPHEGNTGGAVKPNGVDGTIIARREIIAGKQEFGSEKEVIAVVFENRPVTIGENGNPATQKEVDTTYVGRIVEPPKVIQIVEKRRKQKMVEKRAQMPVSQKTMLPTRETNLEELDPALAEVFQKAA